MDGYECVPDPGPDWVPTKKDERRQREREEIQRHAQLVAADAPPLSKETIERVATLLSRPARPEELMQWRLRLFCGHVVLRTAHHTHTTVHGAFMGGVRCPECGLDPATIIAAEAIGRIAGPLVATRSRSAATDAEGIRLAIARHEREISRLRSQLVDGDDPST